MIQLKNVSKTYSSNRQKPVQAVKNTNVAIKKGEFIAIVGPSGSGKSTLMNIMGMLDRPSTGEYYFENREVNTLSEDELAMIRNKKIGFVFQRFHLLPKTTAVENVELPLLYSNRKNIRSLAMKALAQVGLANRATHRASELSGGEQQRVAIARALVNEPEIIFADEPTGNLDSKSGQEIIRIFQALNNDGKTIILVTHDQAVATFARRTIRIQNGVVNENHQERII
jgi:putative ABC transport system ATP-binding protein